MYTKSDVSEMLTVLEKYVGIFLEKDRKQHKKKYDKLKSYKAVVQLSFHLVLLLELEIVCRFKIICTVK